MKKKIAIVALVILAAFVFIINTSCKNEAPKDYFPIGVGSYWEYVVYTMFPSGLSEVSIDVHVVSGKELVDDLECYRVDYTTVEGTSPSIGRYREFLAKTNDGVSITKRAFPLLKHPVTDWELRNSPVEPRYKTNLKAGDRWEWKGLITLQVDRKNQTNNRENASQEPPKTIPIEGKLDFECKGVEKIKVMNKEMECIKIYVHALSEDKQEFDRVSWYGPNIGKVREETTFYKGSDVIKTLMEITSYNITNRELFKGK